MCLPMWIARNILHTLIVIGCAFCNFIQAPRRKVLFLLGVILFAVMAITFMIIANVQFKKAKDMAGQVADLQSKLEFLQLRYNEKQQQFLEAQARGNVDRFYSYFGNSVGPTNFSSGLQAMLRNMTGTRAAAGIHPKMNPDMRTSFVYQLLPHLMNNPRSLLPAYHMTASRSNVDVVIGVPSVKRDKESYVLMTVDSLVTGLTPADNRTTLIVVMIGETDIEYVLDIAQQLNTLYRNEVESGLIEVIAPTAEYYPDLESLPDTLGDSHKRVKWRTKQNLDAIYLMAYAKTKGTYFLMLEDDVIAQKNYMQDIKQFTTTVSVTNPNWMVIDYCQVGGIGKLFRSSSLAHFITYVQLFYKNMPIDWLMESYLADSVCANAKNGKECVAAKDKVRLKYKKSLFQHIGVYSSLKGKIQKVKETHYGAVYKFFPHKNPPVDYVRTDIQEHSDHTLLRAYEGKTFFWGMKPKRGDLIEFWFEKPTNIVRYTFRSGNAEHVSDKFYHTTVQVLPQNSNGTFVDVGHFDELGMAEGDLKMGPLSAIRLRLNRNSTYWALLSEIDLKVDQVKLDSG